MLHPERMRLVTVLAEKGLLPRLVHLLHSLRQVHLAPSPAGYGGFLSGSAAHSYFPVEGYLVEVRGLKEYLQLAPPARATPISERELILTLPERLEELTSAVRTCRSNIEELSAEEARLEREIQALAPMAEADLPVPLDLLDGYQSVEAVTVSMPVSSELPATRFPVEEIESHSGRTSIRLLVAPREHAGELRRILQEAGAEPVQLPSCREHLTAREEARHLRERLEAARLERSGEERKLRRISEDHRAFVYAAEEALVALLEKNHGSTYCAESGYVLVSRFWATEAQAGDVAGRIREAFPGKAIVEVTDAPGRGSEGTERSAAGTGPEDRPEPPTLLRNRRWARPFEMLLDLYGVPRYSELDPTWLLALSFPLFFGFMVGDAGYGAAMLAVGLWLRRRTGRTGRGGGGAGGAGGTADLGWCLLLAGASALLFGALVFGEAFAIPFQREEGMVFWWGRLGLPLPHPVVVKTQASAMSDMLVLSVLAGWLHMSVGSVLGVINLLGHSRRHALGRLGQIPAMTGMALLVLDQEPLRASALGGALWGGLLRPVEAAGAGQAVLWLILAGGLLMAAADGPAGVIELFGLFANVVSFSRLALVGVSKAAVALAVNGAILPMIASADSASGWLTGLLLLLVCHAMLVSLGALTASIQSLRLNYYEGFSKFFEGGGSRFAPFGAERIYTAP